MQNKSIKLLFYCTKAKPYLVKNPYYGILPKEPTYITDSKEEGSCGDVFNGKVVAEADCDLVEKEEYSYLCDEYATFDDDRLENACLSRKQINEYGKYKPLYLIHLKNVKPFDNPKKLSEYYQPKNSCMNSFGWLVDAMNPIQRASQNMMYGYDKDGNLVIIVSVQSPHMCNTLNGVKTIEIRTHIVNALKGLIR